MRVLPAGAAEPGPFRSERTPYMIAPQRACADPTVRRVSIVCGSQMGKTDSVLNILACRLDDDPAPAIYVGPTRSNVEKVIEPRLLAALRSAPSLWAKVTKGRAASKTAKRVAGVLVRLAWAGSASELASQEAALAILDELDRMELDVSGEGSPIELVDARLSTFPDGKMVLTSTPTEGNVVEQQNSTTKLTHWAPSDPGDVASAIWKIWQEGTREEWSWPCPECGEYFVPRFSLLKWPPKATVAIARREARLACPHCGVLIDDAQKAAMNARGAFVAPGQRVTPAGEVIGAVEANEHRSFWISGLCSPWRSFGQRAAAYVAAVRSGDPGRVKAALNTGLGELYRVGGDAPDWQEVRKRAGVYASGEVPAGVLALTAGVDVQKDRLVYAVRGWGYGLESWLIEFGELWGDTASPEVWARLNELMLREWGGLSLRLMVVDSGYKPGEDSSDHAVYTFCRASGGRAVPSKGHDSQTKPLHAATIDVRFNGAIIKRGLQLWHLDSDYFKSFVHGRLKLPADQPGQFHLPHDVTEDYCQQLVAEARAAKASGRATWVRIRKDNHALDCEAMNVAAAHILGVHMVRAPKSQTEPETPTAPPPAAPPPIQRPQQHGRPSWVTGWRR